MTFDTLVAKCPNPCCYLDMILEMQDLDNRLAVFRCPGKKCKVDFVNMQIGLIEKPNNKKRIKEFIPK